MTNPDSGTGIAADEIAGIDPPKPAPEPGGNAAANLGGGVITGCGGSVITGFGGIGGLRRDPFSAMCQYKPIR